MNRILLAACVLAFAGCFNFDQAYDTFCDGGRCTAAGGGAATGGGSATGGGTSTGGGVETGGGTATGGGIATGGGMETGGGTGVGGGAATGGGTGIVDAGCADFLCAALDWTSTQTGRNNPVTAGVLTQTQSVHSPFFLYAAFQITSGTSSGSHRHYEFRFNTPGQTTGQALERTSTNDSRVEGNQLRGISYTDYWHVYRTAATHYDSNAGSEYFTGATRPDGGPNTDPYLYAVAPVSATEAWLVGWPNAIQHWTVDGGVASQVATVEPNDWYDLNLNDVYVTPAGEVYAVGADRMTDVGYVVRENGTIVDSAAVVDDWYGDGFNSIDGTAEKIYVLHRSNAVNHGTIHARNADGGFTQVYEAPFRLARLDVEPSGEVWAVGENTARIVYFDGGTWSTAALPTTEFRSVRWENINALPDGIIISGFETQADGGRAAVVNSYRRFGK